MTHQDDPHDPRNREPLSLAIGAEDERDRPLRRHPGDFDDYPSDEQKEYYKRGGR